MSGNGVDIAAVYQLLAQVAETVNEHTRILNEHTQIMHDQGRRLADIESGQRSLRQAVVDYHSSVVGHGNPISELDHRVRRIKEHLNLPPVA